ncbi:unnamed protein product [Rodentolepis nana]|uniref:Uncharacterized protein n=1 Tax=Rodentolepis nana TaxID=102285 RepID=A0A3P7T0L5_RODNA|nr:unnamed protein product [Rodentolepis nana]
MLGGEIIGRSFFKVLEDLTGGAGAEELVPISP